MEVQKEAFGALMEYYKLLPIQNKRNEIINELELLIGNYSKICTKLGIIPDMTLNREMLNINRENLKEEEFLHAVFAYINTVQEVSGQFIDTMTELLKNKM